MSGGGGGIIIIKNSSVTLTDPQVHGSLPVELQDLVDPILARDPGTWDHVDKVIVAHVYSWALCNLQ